MPRTLSGPFRIGHRHQLHPRLRSQTSPFPGAHVFAVIVAATLFSPLAWSSDGRKSRDAAALIYTPERADSRSRPATRNVASTCAGDRAVDEVSDDDDDGPSTEPEFASRLLTAAEAQNLLHLWRIASAGPAEDTPLQIRVRADARERVLRRLAGVEQAAFDTVQEQLSPEEWRMLTDLRGQGSELPPPLPLTDAARELTEVARCRDPTSQRDVMARVAIAKTTRKTFVAGVSDPPSCRMTDLDSVILWRGTTIASANSIVATGRIGGEALLEGAEVQAPTEDEAKKQVAEIDVLPEGTTNKVVALSFASAGSVVVIFKVCADHITRGSVTESGWIMRREAPVEVVAIISDPSERGIHPAGRRTRSASPGTIVKDGDGGGPPADRRSQSAPPRTGLGTIAEGEEGEEGEEEGEE